MLLLLKHCYLLNLKELKNSAIIPDINVASICKPNQLTEICFQSLHVTKSSDPSKFTYTP